MRAVPTHHSHESLLYKLDGNFGPYPNWPNMMEQGRSSSLTYRNENIPGVPTLSYSAIYNRTSAFTPQAYITPPTKGIDGEDYFYDALQSLYEKESTDGKSTVIPSNTHLKENVNLEYRSRAVTIIFESFCGVHDVNENVIPLAVNMLDRLMCKEDGVPNWICAELLGSVCFKLAFSYENDSAYFIEDFTQVYGVPQVTKRVFTRCEARVLCSLDHNLNIPQVFQFVKVIMDDARHYGVFFQQVVKYLCNICSMDHRFVGQLPSKIAASAVYIAQRVSLMDCEVCSWDKVMEHSSGGYTLGILAPVLHLIIEKFSNPINPQAFSFYASNENMGVSVAVHDWAKRLQMYCN